MHIFSIVDEHLVAPTSSALTTTWLQHQSGQNAKENYDSSRHTKQQLQQEQNYYQSQHHDPPSSILARLVMANRVSPAAQVPRSVPAGTTDKSIENGRALNMNGPTYSTIISLEPSSIISNPSIPAPRSPSNVMLRSSPALRGLASGCSELTMPPPMLPPSPPSSNAMSLTNALLAINDGTSKVKIYDHNGPVKDTSPFSSSSIASTASTSPRIPPKRQNSGGQTPRVRPHATTLSIPGMTRSNVSPDGKIADRDVAAKLVIIMVGLPARGKSYITKKIKRYFSWQQHNTRIFNVGSRRRVAATGNSPQHPHTESSAEHPDPARAAHALLNGALSSTDPAESPDHREPDALDLNQTDSVPMDQSASFFDPNNDAASKFREQLADDTLDELLHYLLHQGGAVGILDATNSTIERRQRMFDLVKKREPKLGVLFIESVCQNKDILEANIRLKLSGPDYKDKDPVKSLADFRARVAQYEIGYVPLGDYEEEKNMQYIKMIDVGKKVTFNAIEGFLATNINNYLASFNLAPRQIWITRHGQSCDNELGKIGGNSELTERGHYYGQALYNFVSHKRKEWLVEQKSKIAASSFPPMPGDKSPPYPELNRELDEKNTCIWTSGLTRSVQTAEYFEADEDYDVKAFHYLNELNAGKFEGMTYQEIAKSHTKEFMKRQEDKLHYVYPGVGGEGYLHVISRLRDVVKEIERIKDHLVIIGHRSICRVLMAYFMDLTQDSIADLDMPLGMLYSLEPKPYGIEFHAYKYNEAQQWFDELPNYKPQRTIDPNA